MEISKNSLDETIIRVKGFKKPSIIRIEIDGNEIMKFRFDNIVNFGNLIKFYNGNSLPVSIKPEFIRNKLKFDFQTEEFKFYNLSIKNRKEENIQ